MSNYCQGDIWSCLAETELLCVTTNSTLNSKGELVMGAGSALQAKKRFPMLPLVWGNLVKNNYTYGLLIYATIARYNIGALQTKYSYRDESPIELVKFSLLKLSEYAEDNYQHKIDSVMPAIGLGGRSFYEIKQLTDQLPNNVTFWYS